LTLSLSLSQAQLISIAAQRGQFSVALRNPDDQRTVDGIPDMHESALTATQAGAGDTVASRPASPVRLRDALVRGAAP
jgi:pilus assembly protein CpaB